jgi:Tfp pilus assembly protein PilO
MTDGVRCPPECEVKLDSFKEDIDTLEDEMKERPRTRTLFLIFGPILTLLLFFIGYTFDSLRDGQKESIAQVAQHQEKNAEALKESQHRAAALLKDNQEKIERKLDKVREYQIRVMSKIGLDEDPDK